MNTATTTTYDGIKTEGDYWALVLGGPDAETVVRDFFRGEDIGADVAGWLDECEAFAAQEVGVDVSGVVQEWRDRAILSIREKLFEMS